MNQDSYDSKKLLIKNINLIIKNNNHNYKIYFTTITFGNSRHEIKRISYNEFFKRFHTLIKNNSTVDNKDISHRPKILLVPEISKQLKRGMFTPNHFHGFVMIPKTRLYKWERKGIDGYYCDLEWKKTCITLKPKFQNTPIHGLMIETVKMFEVEDDKDIDKISTYSLKNFHHFDFDSDDILLFT
jgi:hypothetical protein